MKEVPAGNTASNEATMAEPRAAELLLSKHLISISINEATRSR